MSFLLRMDRTGTLICEQRKPYHVSSDQLVRNIQLYLIFIIFITINVFITFSRIYKSIEEN